MMHAQLNARWFLSAFSAQRINTPWQPWRDGALFPPTLSPKGSLHTYITSFLTLKSQIMIFSAKSNRCENRARRSDGTRRCDRASMNFNTFAEGIFLRLLRSYRVAEKSDPIGSREPNYSGDANTQPSWHLLRSLNFLMDATQSSQTEKTPCRKCIKALGVKLMGPERA